MPKPILDFFLTPISSEEENRLLSFWLRRVLLVASGILTLYRDQFRGKQRLLSAWSAAGYGALIALEEIETLDHLHTRLDHAVLEAYAWPHNLPMSKSWSACWR
jgi:hypothetical protein